MAGASEVDTTYKLYETYTYSQLLLTYPFFNYLSGTIVKS